MRIRVDHGREIRHPDAEKHVRRLAEVETHRVERLIVFNNSIRLCLPRGRHLYIGATNGANGGEVWLYLHNRNYLPLVSKGR